MVRLIRVRSWLGGAGGHGHIKCEVGIRPVQLAAGPTDRRGFFGLYLLPHARAVAALQPEVMQVGSGGQFQWRMPLLFQLDAPNSSVSQALGHQFEFVTVLDITSEHGWVHLALDAQEIGIGLREMVRFEVCGEQAADVLEGQLEEARRDGTAQKRAYFIGQLAETQELVLVEVRRGFEFITVGMKCGEFGQEFAKFEVNLERDGDGSLDQGWEPGAEAIESSQEDDLLELDSAHSINTE